MADFSVIITAGGVGKRMGNSLPKQFIEVAGKPVLFHTLNTFYQFNDEFQLIVTLPEDWLDYWNSLLAKYQFDIPHKVVTGGSERFHSIKNALTCCEGSYVMVHDGVRPLVSSETLDRCISALRKSNAVIPVVEVTESLRQIEGSTTKAVLRKDYRIVQTPQCFSKEILERAYRQGFHEGITDDASLVEQMGISITCVDGNTENIKITNPSDLILVNTLLK